MSAPVTTKTGAPFSSCSTRFSFTTDKPNGFGRNGDLVANTPTRVFPPSLGGRTVADHFPGFLTFSENSQISQRWENSSIPRCLRAGKFRFKRRSGLQISGQSALPGNPEFCRKVRMDIRHRADHMVRVPIFSIFCCHTFSPHLCFFPLASLLIKQTGTVNRNHSPRIGFLPSHDGLQPSISPSHFFRSTIIFFASITPI